MIQVSKYQAKMMMNLLIADSDFNKYLFKIDGTDHLVFIDFNEGVCFVFKNEGKELSMTTINSKYAGDNRWAELHSLFKDHYRTTRDLDFIAMVQKVAEDERS